ncbi:MAG: hypothetical protein GY856_35735 [bacterium]|nr:hypothetical protein [bacterium]
MIQLRRTDVSGRYRGVSQGAAVDLRVDVGNEGALGIISGDLAFENGPGNFEFHHSFQSTDLVLQDGDDAQALLTKVKIYRDDILSLARIDLEIPDEGDPSLTYSFFRLTPFGRKTAARFQFSLERISSFFRRVELEIDQVRGVPLPEPFLTNSLAETPAEVPPRTLDVAACYRDAGIDLAVTLGGEDVPVDEAGPDGRWTDEELHAAMAAHFSAFENEPQWRLYLLLATRYVEPGVLGIMFDSGDEAPRQGAAVFADHAAIANAPEADRNREYLYTIVHELGHAFNLLHAFQKGIFSTHGVLPRPASLSWMNYPQLFPFGYAGPENWDGSQSFWSQFPFRFDTDELTHMRHHDRQEVIMGGEDFGFAGHLEERPFQEPSGAQDLSLGLWLPPAVEFLQQVEGDVRLRNDGREGVAIAPALHPAAGNLELLIRRSTDRYPKLYRHFSRACVRSELRQLAPGEACYQELAPSFGQRHWFIDEPGTYEVQAIYRVPDGRRLASNKRRLRVLTPDAATDRLAPDFFTNDTGTYFGVEGSRADGFGKTRETLAEVCDRAKGASIARQVTVVNAVRDTRVFKDVRSGKVVRPDRAAGADALLRAAGATAKSPKVKVDPAASHLRLARHLHSAARGFAADADAAGARRAVGAIGHLLSVVKAPPAAKKALKAFEKELKL